MNSKVWDLLSGGIDVIGAVLVYVFGLCAYAAVFAGTIEPAYSTVLDSSLTAGELAAMSGPFLIIALFGAVLRILVLVPDVVAWFKRLAKVESA